MHHVSPQLDRTNYIYIYIYVKVFEQKGAVPIEFVSKAALPLKFLAIIKKYDIIRYKSQNPTDDR